MTISSAAANNFRFRLSCWKLGFRERFPPSHLTCADVSEHTVDFSRRLYPGNEHSSESSGPTPSLLEYSCHVIFAASAESVDGVSHLNPPLAQDTKRSGAVPLFYFVRVGAQYHGSETKLIVTRLRRCKACLLPAPWPDRKSSDTSVPSQLAAGCWVPSRAWP